MTETQVRTATGPVGVGFIGVGMISNTYLENLTRFPDIEVVILGDLDQDRARAQARTTTTRSSSTRSTRSSMFLSRRVSPARKWRLIHAMLL